MTDRIPGSNIEIIFADWLDAIRRGDAARMRDRLAPDAVHQGVRPGLLCGNRDEILAQAGRQANLLPSVDALELIAVGDRVVMSVRAPGIGVPEDGSDQPRGQACVVFTFRDGIIVRMDDYVRRADALAAAGASSGWL